MCTLVYSSSKNLPCYWVRNESNLHNGGVRKRLGPVFPTDFKCMAKLLGIRFAHRLYLGFSCVCHNKERSSSYTALVNWSSINNCADNCRCLQTCSFIPSSVQRLTRSVAILVSLKWHKFILVY